jgi:hypothetical protein
MRKENEVRQKKNRENGGVVRDSTPIRRTEVVNLFF